VDYKIETSGNAFIVSGTIKESGVPDGFMMAVPVYADDSFLGNVQVGDTEGEFRYRVSNKPERILIDPERTILTAATSQ
jgi:hypothetical protein